MKCSSHKLMIEKGRYLNLERNQRICSMCNLNDIEDDSRERLPMHRFNVINYIL